MNMPNGLSGSPVILTSSAIAEAAYDRQRRILQIEFRDRSVYLYLDVPPEVYQGLLSAHSQGAYFNTFIRKVYRHQSTS